jgi:hypothetical protein
MTRVLTDFHHSSLLTATNMLFGDRLGMEVYRPIGMEWFEEGFWAINDQRDTAKQYLELDSQPLDNTPPLNKASEALLHSPVKNSLTYKVREPGDSGHHRAATLDFFKQNRFDYVIASIPAHVPIFERLIAKHAPGAKLIIQVGNNWGIDQYHGKNVLASIAPRPAQGVNIHFYHQEFDLDIFKPKLAKPTKKIHSFVNILQGTGQGWTDFTAVEQQLPDYSFKSYGGQCRDGNMNGPYELARSMHEAQFVFHSKPGGDGFGHIIHNAYAVGRPVIVRPSQYRGHLPEYLLVPGTYLDLDKHTPEEIGYLIQRSTLYPDILEKMGTKAAERFGEVVDYYSEAQEVAKWLSSL